MFLFFFPISTAAGPRSAVVARFDTWSGHIPSFLLSLTQEGQLSVSGESMCTKHWLTT